MKFRLEFQTSITVNIGDKLVLFCLYPLVIMKLFPAISTQKIWLAKGNITLTDMLKHSSWWLKLTLDSFCSPLPIFTVWFSSLAKLLVLWCTFHWICYLLLIVQPNISVGVSIEQIGDTMRLRSLPFFQSYYWVTRCAFR